MTNHKHILHPIIILSILSLFSTSAYSEDEIIRGSCRKVPGVFINNNPTLYGFNPSKRSVAQCNALVSSMNAMHSYHRFRRMEAERIRLAWIHHKNYVDAERKYRREEYEAKKKALEEEKERRACEAHAFEEAKYRVFTGKNGATIDAKVCSINNGKVMLRTRNHSVYYVSLSNLKDDDIGFLHSWHYDNN